MRVAVVGGTGLVGRHVVEALRRQGVEAVALARSTGVDALTGEGLDAALNGADAVVDVTTTPARSAEETQAFFRTTTRNLMAAEERVGVKHHVLLSIAAVDAVPDQPHYVGKLAQEDEAQRGSVPVTIARVTQFHEFGGQVATWSTQDGQAIVAPLLLRPVAARDVGAYLAELALGDPQGRAKDLSGPRNEDLFDMARRTLAARGVRTTLVPGFDGMFGMSMAGEVLLPGPDARIAPTTFDQWLLEQAQPA
jgi:uncharacterized protein YbjT (DUF2867 family)